MGAKHSPSPWKWDAPGPEGTFASALKDANGKEILFGQGWEVDGVDVENPADRALIEAAPELRDALSELLRAIFQRGRRREERLKGAVQGAGALLSRLDAEEVR